MIDRGPGIPQVGQARAFEPFQRLPDHASSDDAGVGLGLALARGFTEAMSGVLTMEDTPGGGLTMVVQVPTAQPSESSPV